MKKMRLHLRGVRLNSGFTLPEILVVIAIVAIMGLILVGIFINTLRGSNKSQVLASIKQNGQAVLENMDKIIRGSDSVICLSDPTPDTLVLVNGDIYTRFRIDAYPFSDCPQSGCVLSDNPEQGARTFEQFKQDVCTSTDTMISPKKLSDTDTKTGVYMESGSFTVLKQPGYKEQVQINFVLKPGISAPPAITSQIDPVTFQTSVQLR